MATTAERLTEARDALHLLMLGQQTVEMRVGDKTMRFTATSMETLRRYIRDLEDQLATEAGNRPAPRFRSIVFG